MESAPERALLQKINVARILASMFALKMSERSKQQGNKEEGGGHAILHVSHYSRVDTAQESVRTREFIGVPAACARSVIRGCRLSLSAPHSENGIVHSGH